MESFLSRQVNYNQVVAKCHILQECILQNFKIWNIHIQGLLKDPMNPVYRYMIWLHDRFQPFDQSYALTDIM